MQITRPIRPTPSSPPVLPSGSPMPSSFPETVPPTPPCIPTSVPSRLSWHGPNLLLFLPRAKFYVSFYFPLHQRPHPHYPTWRSALERGDAIVTLQAVAKPFPDLPNVPLAISLAKDDEGRQLIEAGLHNPSVFDRPFVLSPGTPKDRVQILVKAFQETMKDNEYIAEVKKAQLDLNPKTGEELAEKVNGIFKLSPDLVAKLQSILFK